MNHIRSAPFLAAAALLAGLAGPASAVTSWTDWTSATVGEPGTASGTLEGIGISYSGEVGGSTLNGSTNIWAPTSTFVGGVVTASPATVNDAIFLNGSAITSTLTFSSPILDPVFAIWSLGAPSVPASFTFSAAPTLEAGGPNSQYGGSSISVSGNSVSGREGNGVVRFIGSFSSLSFTSTAENFYAFSVGHDTASPVTAVPEPGTWALMLAGLGVVGLASRRREQR